MSMFEYDNFLTIHKAKDGGVITHTAIPNKKLNVYGGKYHIPEADLKEFYDLYYDVVFEKKKQAFLTEAQPKEECPLLVDLDFKFDKCVEDRVWNNDHIDAIIGAYCEEIDNVFDIPEGASYKIYVSQRKEPRLEDEYTKDGIHAVFAFSCPRSVQLYIRERMVERGDIKEMIQSFNITNTMEDVFDLSISRGTTNWMLFGSRKPGTGDYRITHAYNVCDGEFEYETFQLTRQSFEDLLATNKNIPKFQIRKCMIEEIASQTSTPVLSLSPSTTQAHRPIVICDDAKAFIDANCPALSAEHYNTWFPECVKIIRQFGLDQKGVPTDEARELVHYFSQKSKTNYKPCGPKSVDEWLDNYDDTTYWLTTVFPQPRPEAGVCHIKLPEEEVATKNYAVANERNDFYNMIDNEVADIEYAKMFYSMCPDKYFYSEQTEWWELRDNQRYYNTGKTMPIGITNILSDVLRKKLEEYRKNLNPLDEKTQARSKKLLKEYKRLGDRRPLENIASFLPKQCLIEKEEFDFKMDANTNLIAFNDCVYDLRTNEFRKITPKDFISKTTRYNMGDRKSNPEQRKKVLALFESIFPDVPLREYWLKCSALSFFTNRFEMLYILTGTGGNGKGILTSFLKACGGDYVMTAEQTFLTSITKGNQASPCLASAEGVRIVLVSEPDNGERNCYMNVEFVKAITGRDEISARFLFANNKVFEPRFTVLMSCNNKPEIRKLDKGLLRRLSIHPFLCSYKSNPDPSKKYEKKGDSTLKDLKYDEAFIKEFMLYMIEIAYANKDVKDIEMPETAKEAVEEYVADNNHVKAWFEAHYKKVNEPTEGDTKEWKKKHSHSTGDILKKFNATEHKITAQQLLNAFTYNEIPTYKKDGYRWIRYYEYYNEIEDDGCLV